jgi:hypothetical protein
MDLLWPPHSTGVGKHNERSLKRLHKICFVATALAIIGFASVCEPSAIHAYSQSDAVEADFTPPLRRLTGIAPFDEALSLLRAHYCKKIPDSEIFQWIIHRMAINVLPTCTEDLDPYDQCRDEPEVCFFNAISTVAR